MLVLTFAGWFQCRLATNPDPTDEPRGVSGFTVAVAGEPDFDRIIRLHHPIAHRSHAPEVGVHVTSAVLDGAQQDDHPLLGASFDLLDDPKFESRNLLLSDDKAGTGLIHPFHLCVRTANVRIERRDILFPPDPERDFLEVPAESLNRRAPVSLEGMTQDSIRIAEATGILSPRAYRERRRRLLEADRAESDDAVERAALRRRLEDLKITDPMDMRTVSMTLCQTRRFNVNGPVTIEGNLEGIEADGADDWPIEFWLGAWDADALCGYMKGALTIP